MTDTLDLRSEEGSAADGPADRRLRPGPVVAIVFAVLSVGVAVAIVVWYATREGPEGMDRLTHWQCLNVEVCGETFSMTLAEFYKTIQEGPPSGIVPELSLAELNAQSQCGLSPDMPLWCPHCGSYIISRGYPCPHCESIVRLGAHGVLPDVCTSCGRDPGRPAEDAEAPPTDL